MAEPTYRVVFSATDGTSPISSTPLGWDDAWAHLQTHLRDSGGRPLDVYRPDGTERMRVVDEAGWARIRDAADRSRS